MIFVGVPVYRGCDLVQETLRSIRDQEFRDFHVLISVDGSDERSAGACTEFTEDPRFELVVQRERLGWAANLNWLMSQCSSELFCYWQQDDYCAASYFRALHDHAIHHPEAACVYADMEWVGFRSGHESLPSVTGSPLRRVLQTIEKGHFAPFRGLIRRDAIAAAGPLRITAFDSRLEDLVWVAKIARAGELRRVPQTLYFKRAHGSNAHSNSNLLPKSLRRGVWIEYGLGMLEAVLPLATGLGRTRLLNTVLERLIVGRPERWMYYDPWQYGPDEVVSFARDFVDTAVERFGADGWEGLPRLPDPQAALEILDAGPSVTGVPLIGLALREPRFQRLVEGCALEGRGEVTFARGDAGTSLLGEGWSTPEDWGVWSERATARLRLPIPCDGCRWQIAISGRAFVAGLASCESRSLLIRDGAENMLTCKYSLEAAHVAVEHTLLLPDSPLEIWWDFEFPDAVSPEELGISVDRRRLALGLERITLQRVESMPSAGHARPL